MKFWSTNIASSGTAGTLTVAGNFDKTFGFRFKQSPGGHEHFTADGIVLADAPPPPAGSQPTNKKVIFSISISEMMQTNNRVVLKYADPNDNDVDIHVTGGLNVDKTENTDNEFDE